MFLSPSAGAIRHIPCTRPPEPGPAERCSSFDDDIEQIRHLPESGRLPEFQRLIDAPGALDEARLAALAGTIRYLHINERLRKFNVLLQMNREFLARHPVAFIEQIGHLAPEQRQGAFERLLGDAAALDPQDCAAHLETLGGQIRRLDAKDRINGFDGISCKIEQFFPVQQRAAQLISLARQTPYLENKHMFDRFDCVLDKIIRLCTEEQRVAHLGTLTREIESFPEQARLRVFQRMAALIRALGKEQQLDEESCIGLLHQLKVQISCLSPYGCNEQLAAKIIITQAATDLNLRERAPRPAAPGLTGDALQTMQSLAALGGASPAAAAVAVMQLAGDGRHIGLKIAGLMNRYPQAGGASLKTYLELINALHMSAHLTSEEVQSLLLPKCKEDRRLPISAVVASHWQSQVAQPFVSTLANSARQSAAKKLVRSRLQLAQSDQHHWQLRMQGSADFYKQIKRGIADLSAGEQNTAALRLLAGHGLIARGRDLGRIAKRLPAAAPAATSPMPTLSEISIYLNNVLPAVLPQEASTSSPAAVFSVGSSNPLHAGAAAAHAPGISVPSGPR